MIKLRILNAWTARAVAAIGATLAMTSGLASPPAHAASEIYAALGINVDGVGDNKWSNAWVNVHLPMNQYDAQGYINNGARIEIECWGDDYFSDDDVFGINRYVANRGGSGDYLLPGADVWIHNVNRLYADTSGVNLTAVFSAPYLRLGASPGLGFNEDTYPGDADEIYCKATWIDGTADKLSAFTNVTRGDF